MIVGSLAFGIHLLIQTARSERLCTVAEARAVCWAKPIGRLTPQHHQEEVDALSEQIENDRHPPDMDVAPDADYRAAHDAPNRYARELEAADNHEVLIHSFPGGALYLMRTGFEEDMGKGRAPISTERAARTWPLEAAWEAHAATTKETEQMGPIDRLRGLFAGGMTREGEAIVMDKPLGIARTAITEEEIDADLSAYEAAKSERAEIRGREYGSVYTSNVAIPGEARLGMAERRTRLEIEPTADGNGVEVRQYRRNYLSVEGKGVVSAKDIAQDPFSPKTLAKFGTADEAQRYINDHIRDYNEAAAEHQSAGEQWLAEQNAEELEEEPVLTPQAEDLTHANRPAVQEIATALGVQPTEAVDRYQEMINAHETTGRAQYAETAEQGREIARQEVAEALTGLGVSRESIEEIGRLQYGQPGPVNVGKSAAREDAAYRSAGLGPDASSVAAPDRSGVDVKHELWRLRNEERSSLADQQKRAADLGLTVEQIQASEAFDARFGETAIEHSKRGENGHQNGASTAVLLDKASVLADQAQNPTGISDADATMTEMSSLERTLEVTANGQSPEVSAVLYGTADDIDPETLRVLTADTPQDRREDLARKAELYAASVGAAPDSSLGAAVQKFAADVRSGNNAIDMTQWFEPQQGVSIESNERLAATTKERVSEGMQPLFEEARALGVQVDSGSFNIAQKQQIREDVTVASQKIGF